jgi:hypothetical protein
MYTFRSTVHVALSPCFFSPCWLPFAPLSYSPLLTWNPPCCDRICPPWSQVACKLTSPSLTLPTPSPFQIPSTHVIYTVRLAMTTSRLRLLLSGTDISIYRNLYICCRFDLYIWNTGPTENNNFRLFAANGKWKFVFLGRQMNNGNQRLFQQTCPSTVSCLETSSVSQVFLNFYFRFLFYNTISYCAYLVLCNCSSSAIKVLPPSKNKPKELKL